MNLQIEKWTDAPIRVETDGAAVSARITIYMIHPARCTIAELKEYIQAAAESDAGFYHIRNHPVLPDFEAYDTGIDVLVHQVAGWLHERGLSIADDPLGVWVH